MHWNWVLQPVACRAAVLLFLLAAAQGVDQNEAEKVLLLMWIY